MANPMTGFILDVQDIQANVLSAKQASTEAGVVADLEQILLDINALLLLMSQWPDKTVRQKTLQRGELVDESEEVIP
jgi:hypothetical protein